jgi:serine/threonine protein kinase
LTAKVGSPAYWAPEIFDEELYSAKVDIWAIGVIFFEILTKTHPFVPDSKVSQKVIMKAIKENDLQFPDIISAASRELVTKMLQKNP